MAVSRVPGGHPHPSPTWKPPPSTHLAHQHLIEQHTQPPPVHSPRVGLLGQHFGGQELWGAAEGARPVPKADPCKATFTLMPAWCLASTAASAVGRLNDQALGPHVLKPVPSPAPHSWRWGHVSAICLMRNLSLSQACMPRSHRAQNAAPSPSPGSPSQGQEAFSELLGLGRKSQSF